MLRKALFTLYVLVLVAMATATVVEALHDTPFAHKTFYGAWWFVLLWALLTAVGIAWIVRRKMRRPAIVALHGAFVVILIGALVTHLCAERGTIHLRLNEPTSTFTTEDEDGRQQTEQLPFTLTLTDFRIVYHPGTTSVADYVSTFKLADKNGAAKEGRVSMNNICSYGGARLYQLSYDADELGSYLLLNRDPWGIGLTYIGYALLFISLVWMLIDPRGGFRRALRSETLKRGLLTVGLVAMSVAGRPQVSPLHEESLPVLSKESAEAFGRMYVHYNGRICPVQTLAIDFTKKLCGKRQFNGYTAEQVLTGFLLWPDEWSEAPILKLKKAQLREHLDLPKHTSLASLFSEQAGGYRLGRLVEEYYHGHNDALHQQAADIDARVSLIFDVARGSLLQVFPASPPNPLSQGEGETSGKISWFAPTDSLPASMEPARAAYIHTVLRLWQEDVHSGKQAEADELIRLLRKYQQRYGQGSLPTKTQTKAERLYNAVPFATILFMVDLTAGLLLLIWVIIRIGKASPHSPEEEPDRSSSASQHSPLTVMGRGLGGGALLLSFLALTLCLALRWVISGTVPMANGYETMLLTAWLLQLLTLIACRRLRIVLAFGLLMSGFFLLVSHISQMDPQITHIMPVLSSPLLTIHVSVVMMAYAMLSMTFICALTALILRKEEARAALRELSLLFLYPALTFLGMGIFIGAIWANVSWGSYWSWDPKETWALITLLVYAIGAHSQTVPAMQRPLAFHAFMLVAFLTLLMTYFGVNYVLGGMHSYA